MKESKEQYTFFYKTYHIWKIFFAQWWRRDSDSTSCSTAMMYEILLLSLSMGQPSLVNSLLAETTVTLTSVHPRATNVSSQSLVIKNVFLPPLPKGSKEGWMKKLLPLRIKMDVGPSNWDRNLRRSAKPKSKEEYLCVNKFTEMKK